MEQMILGFLDKLTKIEEKRGMLGTIIGVILALMVILMVVFTIKISVEFGFKSLNLIVRTFWGFRLF